LSDLKAFSIVLNALSFSAVSLTLVGWRLFVSCVRKASNLSKSPLPSVPSKDDIKSVVKVLKSEI